MLDLSLIPASEYTPDTPAEAWHARAVSAPAPFPRGSLAAMAPLAFFPVQLERVLGYSLYFALNFVPMVAVYGYAAAWALQLPWVRFALLCMGAYVIVLYAAYTMLCRACGWHKGQWSYQGPRDARSARRNQYAIGERNTQIYHNMRFVWPAALDPTPARESPPTLFCVVPHGVLPLGALAYPIFSKLFSSRLCRWTAAPVLFSLPIVGGLLGAIGSIPAKSEAITKTLVEGSSDVGIILDGIAGMFEEMGPDMETAHVLSRTGIIAIALKVGNVQIVPVYAFGHSQAWEILQDRFGLMRRLSTWLNVSLVLFIGRWFWPFGPARRLPVTLAFGEPLLVPSNPDPTAKPSPALVEEYHKKFVQGLVETFDTHKDSFGWGHKRLLLT
jgi:1-acyl-sn-glycerol-3-phosphate acyltransferase